MRVVSCFGCRAGFSRSELCFVLPRRECCVYGVGTTEHRYHGFGLFKEHCFVVSMNHWPSRRKNSGGYTIPALFLFVIALALGHRKM